MTAPDRLQKTADSAGREPAAQSWVNGGDAFYGDELMNAGIPVDQSWMAMKGGDFTSLLFEIES